MKTRNRILPNIIILGLLLVVGPASANEAGVYGYFRILDGSATLIQVDTGSREEAEINQPILEGDSLWIAPRARVEIVLSDGSRLRGDGRSELVFQQLSGNADESSVLQLTRGNLQWVLPTDPSSQSAPRIDTDNATIYLHAAGSYRVSADDGWTQVVVREGYAEVLTPRGSTVVRADEQVRIDGHEQANIRVGEAPSLDSLESWGEQQEYRRTDSASARYVGGSLGYSAAVLDDYGSWIVLEGRRAWRPYVSTSWRPYWNGRWSYGSVGMTWVSYEPWGWVPHHYGNWDYWSGYGWVWYPGQVYSPARVHWYWGSGYAGWVPSGYYGRYYGWGLRAGIYGWAGGSWSHYNRWTFCSTRYLGQRRQHAYYRTGRAMGNELRTTHVGRGLITTETRGIRPDNWNDPKQVLASIRGGRDRQGGELPDVTDFVSRKPDLGIGVRERVMPTDGSPRYSRPDVEPKGSDRDRRTVVRAEPEPRYKGSDQEPTVAWRDDRNGSGERPSDWRSPDRGRIEPRIDARQPESPKTDKGGRNSDTGFRPRPVERSDSGEKVATWPGKDRGQDTDTRATDGFRVEPRYQPPQDDRSERRRDIDQQPAVADRGSRERVTTPKVTYDWREVNRDQDRGASARVDDKKLTAMPASPRSSNGDRDSRFSERPTTVPDSSRSWRSTDTTIRDTPVVRRVVDSIRSNVEPYSGWTPRIDISNRYDSGASASRTYERAPSRSETTYRPSSGSESRRSTTTYDRGDSSRKGSSSVRGSDRSRSGSEVKRRSSSSSRSSSSRSKSTRSSSKRRDGRG